MFRLPVILACLAVISAMAMPFGYMPAKAEDGSIILRICDGTMPAPREQQHHEAHAADHHMAMHAGEPGASHTDHDDDGTHEMRCNYAVPAAANLPEVPHIDLPLMAEDMVELPRLAVLTAIFPPNLPPSTGPPAV